MKSAGKHRFTFISGITLAKIAVVLLAVAVASGAQQNPPLLQITSPAEGTVVNPGQTISVTVTSPGNASFLQVGVIGEGPIGFSSLVTSVPAQFSMSIPTNIACRKFMLTAVGATSSGQSAESLTILIDVERPDRPTALSQLDSKTPGLSFDAIGEQLPLVLLGTFSDGSILDVTRSTNVTYSSSDSSIAAVDTNGMVTGTGTGDATITATYSVNGQNVSLAIPVTVESVGITISPTSLTSFGSQSIGVTSTAQAVTVTNTAVGSLKILSVNATGDFSETGNCLASSPLSTNGICTINVTFTPTVAGPRTGTLTVTNDFSGLPTSIPLSGTGSSTPTISATTTAVTSSGNPSVFGQTITLTATVTSNPPGGTPTGTVAFNDGSTVLGTETIASGQASFTTSSLSVGSHSITASYSGDSAFQASAGTLTQTVNPSSTITTVSSSTNPSVLNSSVTLTATVKAAAPGAGTPTGTISFKDGSTTLTTVPVNTAGQAIFSTSSLVVGSHSITATYSGDSNFNGSTSAALNQPIQYGPVGTTCDGVAGHQILPPINADGTSVYNQGRTVPAKFQVCDANGVSIGTPGVVSSFFLTQIVSGTVTTTVQDVVDTNNPDTAFRWDSSGQQWIFNISTKNLSANSTYVYTITLNDGTTINFQFGLR
ncbi:MAG: Ig-like domain repeat protein [Candidatus Acidiferrales bacterium]